MRHKAPHACSWAKEASKRQRPSPQSGGSIFGPKDAEAVIAKQRGPPWPKSGRGPHTNAVGASLAQMWRRRPPDCGRGLGSPKVPEALTPQRREHRWSQIGRGFRSRAARGPKAAKAYAPLRRGTGGPQAGAAPATMRWGPPFVERRQGPLTQSGRALGGPKTAEAPTLKWRGSWWSERVRKSHCHVFLGGLDPGQAPLKTLLLMLRQT